MTSDAGERFVQALASKDAAGLRAVLADDVDFRALTPGKFWESSSAAEVVDDFVLGQWFGPNDVIEGIERTEGDEFADRSRVGYRLRVRNADGAHLVDQQAYYAVDGERISWLRVMCAGYRPAGDA